MFRNLAIAFLTMLPLSAASQDCGPDIPCELAGGSYHMRVPSGEGPHPVLIWYHGHRGNGASIHRAGGLQSAFLDQGYALIAPNGFHSDGGARSYPARDGAPRDDVAFTFAVLADAAAQVNLDAERVYAGGFSAGGSMVWLLGCAAGDRLAGLVSVAGALRRPNATDCAGLEGLPILHIHGFADAQVPLEGRAIRDWHQGSVWETLARARAANGCRSNPDRIEIDATYRSRAWDASCDTGRIRLDLHDGGHGLPRGWANRAREYFETTAVAD